MQGGVRISRKNALKNRQLLVSGQRLVASYASPKLRSVTLVIFKGNASLLDGLKTVIKRDGTVPIELTVSPAPYRAKLTITKINDAAAKLSKPLTVKETGFDRVPAITIASGGAVDWYQDSSTKDYKVVPRKSKSRRPARSL